MISLKLNPDGTLGGFSTVEYKGLKAKPIAKWGHKDWCHAKGDDAHGAWMEDGQCSCGVQKHHEHCVCGGLTQVG